MLDIFERITGKRQNYAMMKPGGVRRDIFEEDFPWIKKILKGLIPKIDMFRGAIMDDPVIRARTEGVGVLTKDDVRDYCAVGPTARASGVNIDIRRDDPYAAYNKVEWQVCTYEGGDVFSKAVVRVL